MFNYRGRVESRSEGREINCRYLERGRGGGSRAQFPGPSRREEQEFAGVISGNEWERGAKLAGSIQGTRPILSVLKIPREN